MIDTNQISVVVQGAIEETLTKDCIDSVRKYLPESEIILSTWERSKMSNIDQSKINKIIFSKDPGGVVYTSCGVNNNVGRQIISTKKGLENTSHEFTLKIRSDMVLNGKGFLKYFNIYNKHANGFKIFNKKILICNYYTNSHFIVPMLFHPSDWVSFGHTEDLIKLWDIPVPSENNYYNYFEDKVRPPNCPHPSLMGKYAPEQHIFVECVKKYLPDLKTIKYFYETDVQLVYNYENLIASNFVVLDYASQYDIEFKKYNPKFHSITNQMDFFQWIKIYKKYCDPQTKIPFLIALKHIFKYKEKNQLIKYGKLHKLIIKWTLIFTTIYNKIWYACRNPLKTTKKVFEIIYK